MIIFFCVLSSLILVQIHWKYICYMIFCETNKILTYKTPKLGIQVFTTVWQAKFGPLISSACYHLYGYVIFHDRMEFEEEIITADELLLKQGAKPGFSVNLCVTFKIKREIWSTKLDLVVGLIGRELHRKYKEINPTSETGPRNSKKTTILGKILM